MKFSAKLFAAIALCLSFAAGASQVAMPTISHASGPTVLSTYNNAFAAVSSMQSGSADPGTNGGPYSFWQDTGTGTLWQRNPSNTGWKPFIASGFFTGTLTGGTTAPTITVSWYRIGNFVHISLPAQAFTSNASTFTITGGPASLGNSSDWADSGQAASTPFPVQSNGAFVTGVAYVNTNGTIVLILSNGASSSWGNSGYKGIGFSVLLTAPVVGVSFSYVIQ